MTPAGELTRYISIRAGLLKPTLGVDFDREYPQVATAWAKVETKDGIAFDSVASAEAAYTHTFTVRPLTDVLVTTANSIVFANNRYQVRRVENPNEAGEDLVIRASFVGPVTSKRGAS